MKELTRQQDQCVTYAKEVAESLLSFFEPMPLKTDEGLFFVSFSREKGFAATVPEPNAATSIICGVIASLKAERAKALCEKDAWDPLVERVKKAINCVVKSQLKDALPLKTMGKLPIHSTTHLTKLLLSYNDVHDLITNSDLFAICIRRLITAIELDLEADNHNSRERLHPYHIYVLTCALGILDEKLRAADFSQFILKLRNCEQPLLTAIKEKYGRDSKIKVTDKAAKSDLDFSWGSEWQKKIETKFTSPEYLSQLLLRAEERAVVLAQAQIAHKASSLSPDFDPSSLTFAIATLSERKAERYRHIIRQGLDILLEVFEEDDFASTIPFMVDDKGRAAFVPSVETANALLKVCEEQLKESRAVELKRAAEVAIHFQKRLGETNQSVSRNNKKISGWCSDKAPSKGRIDSWVTAYALEFFYRSHEIVKLEKRRTIFENYSWRSFDKCNPMWEEIVDPDFNPSGATDNDKYPIKSQIMSLIESEDKKRRAPVFLLYGPPGTSKTSFVNGVAQAKNWDLISLSPSDFISDSVDRIEHRARQIFQDLMNIDECVILFDEMDSLLLDRDIDAVKRDVVLKFVVPAFLPKLQDLHDHVVKSQMAVFFVTNYAERIDTAIKRKGRIDEKILIPPYNDKAREHLLNALLTRKFGSTICDHDDSKSEIGKALGMMSSLSVYREVSEFAHCFNLDGDKIKLTITSPKDIYTDGLSIPPKTYEKDNRAGARDELMKIVKRIASNKVTDWSTWSDERGRARTKFNCNEDFDQWEPIIESWLRPTK